jgi:peptide/nickel transport system substrate-binding protein
MNTVAKLLKVFFSMSRREKGVAILLVIGFFVSLSIFFAGSIRFPPRLEKGTFSEGVIGHIKTLNPLLVDFNDIDRDLSMLIFSGLIRYDPLERNFFPDLAASWQRSADGLNYTLTLRTNAFWHDGKPVTVDDVIFTFRDVIQDPGFRNPILRNAFEGVAIEKISDSSATFTLPKANSYFLSNLTVGLLPKHLLDSTPIANLDKAPFGLHPIGSGPYRITSLSLDEDGDRIDLAAFPQYYGGAPLIPRMRLFTVSDEKNLTKERGAFHALSKLSAEAASLVSLDDRFALTNYSLNQFTALFLNTDAPLLKEKRLRQILHQALNKNELLAPGEKRIDALDLADHGSEPAFQFTLETANKMLDALGLKKQPDGRRMNHKGEPLALTLLTSTKIPLKLTEKIKQMWGGLGIQVNVLKPDAEEFSNLVSERRYDVLLIRQSLGFNRDMYPILHSSQRAGAEGSPSGLNFAQFKSFQTDRLTEGMRREKDPKAKQKLLDQISKVLIEETPVIFLSTPVYSYALDKRVQAFPPSAVLDFHADRFRVVPYLSFPSLDTLRMSP